MSRRKIISRRRGPEDEEDEELGVEEDSYTDDSGLSESEREEDAATDGTLSEEERDDLNEGQVANKGKAAGANGRSGGKAKFVHTGNGDTDVMMNGVRGKDYDAEEVDFSEMGEDDGAEKAPAKNPQNEATEEVSHEETEEDPQSREAEERPHETAEEKRRREHEEYKKRRDADPAFVPNRGAFYLHDHRHAEGFRPFARGGGRAGRGGRFSRLAELTFLQSEYMNHNAPVELQWQHDMHEETHTDHRGSMPAHQSNHSFAPNNRLRGNGDPPRSFGRTVYKGNVQIQVNLPGMKAPITFSEVPSKVYTRLPYHRPPLRRDKPVRIALPDAPVRYIYPSPARSFIFIPRAMRPGGSGYIRGGGRSRGGFYSQGRSVYGGSNGYSPSVGMSRRSSLQFEHKPQFTPPMPAPAQPHQPTAPITGHVESSSRPSVGEEEPPAKPTVPQHPPPSYTPNPVAYREHRATPKIPMHQPRPQKAVNVAEIDSPAVMHFPQSYGGHMYPENIPTPGVPQNMYAHSRQASYPSQPSGTPLSHIPEAAVHARAFHPAFPPQPGYFPYPPQPHPVAQMHPIHGPPSHHHDPRAFHPPPPYVPSGPSPMPNGATNHYAMIPAQQQAPAQPVPVTTGPPTGPTTIAQESNGMVYYSTWDPNQYYTYPAGGPAGYPGTPGMPITPAPDGSVNGAPGPGPVYFYPGAQTPHQHPIYYAQ
ncbi:hypothetical protein L873DRAFT_1686795 [Choiromyces venosus 120613-1]|uniref:Btz domain-containing protein n=1 Tax=Choiromyces venosus 120613-1 TaxID=1336337 RepID=A0A3N4JY37_9PEZI|nr:hypothetical protein L873DRAFT_1686795 [Choiromyces venosus 120613-1]